ncbi:MAG: metallophosphoesterase family protein [Defluviitaleaceae bacterium]|nr:metallophosphoesterase family protein [Defluviitaleaceae bacterium]
MSAFTRVQNVFASADELCINRDSRLVIISDCHRGTGTAADNFAINKNIYYAALKYYLRECFTYIELGDGDELWENKRFPMIMKEHHNIFELLSQFHKHGRLHMIYGNHDMDKKDPAWVARYLEGSPVAGYNSSETPDIPLFTGIKIHEGLVLKHQPSGQEILLIHGHQADFFNFRMWRLARFLVRYIWRPLELIGVLNPFDTPHRTGRRNMVERRLIKWCQQQNITLIAGHTHHTSFPKDGEPPYYNNGSCVSRQQITCIEIQDDCISLVKWSLQPRRDGVLYVRRDVVSRGKL